VSDAPVDAVIFDLDGTLVDHVGSVTAALHAWLPSLGVVATDDLAEAWFDAEERHFPAWRSRQISFAEQRRRRLRDFLPLIGIDPGADKDLDAIFAGYLACYEAAWTTFPDVDAALTALADTGLKTAVLTNGTVEQQTAKLNAVGLRGRTGPVFTAEELGAAKPDSSTYLTVCTQLDVNPGAALHVGDPYELDVLAPRAAGLRAVLLDRADRGPYDEPHRITSLDQLADHVAGT
jgi:putative hydrolase of the HAD superfamily